MRRLRGGVLTLCFATVLAGPTAIAETLFSTSNSSTAGVGDAINAVFEVETSGIESLSARRLSQLSTAPLPDPKKIVGYTRDDLRALPVATGGKQWQCMAEALYFEARGESVLGQFAVAEVILNRVSSSRYPDTVCGVVRQGTGQRHKCQFSFYCDGRAEVISEPKAYELVGKVAKIALNDWDRDLTDGATHYHTKQVSPNWSRVFPRTATIGFHHFYRQPLRLVRR